MIRLERSRPDGPSGHGGMTEIIQIVDTSMSGRSVRSVPLKSTDPDSQISLLIINILFILI